jgi:hypothetical protein
MIYKGSSFHEKSLPRIMIGCPLIFFQLRKEKALFMKALSAIPYRGLRTNKL